MNAVEAVAWVDRNRTMILARVQKYTSYTPYSSTDYLQDAYEAAIKAAIVVERDPSKSFDGVFLNIHRKIVFAVTPYPEEDRNRNKEEKLRLAHVSAAPLSDSEVADDKTSSKRTYYPGYSMSYPANRRDDVALETFRHKTSHTDIPDPIDMDVVFRKYVKTSNVTDKEARAMELAIGITEEGCCTPNEIGTLLGIKGASVRKMIDRAITKTRSNVININERLQKVRTSEAEDGSIAPEEPLVADMHALQA